MTTETWTWSFRNIFSAHAEAIFSSFIIITIFYMFDSVRSWIHSLIISKYMILFLFLFLFFAILNRNVTILPQRKSWSVDNVKQGFYFIALVRINQLKNSILLVIQIPPSLKVLHGAFYLLSIFPY